MVFFFFPKSQKLAGCTDQNVPERIPLFQLGLHPLSPPLSFCSLLSHTKDLAVNTHTPLRIRQLVPLWSPSIYSGVQTVGPILLEMRPPPQSKCLHAEPLEERSQSPCANLGPPSLLGPLLSPHQGPHSNPL